jgi:GlpG protein
VTYATIAVCVANFLLLNLAQGDTLATAQAVLAPSAVQVWHGAVWGLVTTAFVHLQVWHIAFNMWWARDFGRLLEPDMGRGRFAAFVLATAAVSSAWQLLTTDATGIGFSGVVYALFGYALARRGSHPRYAALVSRTTIRWLLGWLLLCIALTVAKVWAVGNAAHVAGLASGWLLGTALEHPRRRVPAAAGGVMLAAGVVLSLAYMPWSVAWRSREATFAIDVWRRGAEAGDPDAESHYGRVLMSWHSTRPDGMKWLRRAAESAEPKAMNALAWYLATAREDELRDGAEAIRWAEQARAAAPSANVEDTLAAAYAEADRWEDALAAEDRALRASADTSRALFESHRASYERREKWRE